MCDIDSPSVNYMYVFSYEMWPLKTRSIYVGVSISAGSRFLSQFVTRTPVRRIRVVVMLFIGNGGGS